MDAYIDHIDLLVRFADNSVTHSSTAPNPKHKQQRERIKAARQMFRIKKRMCGETKSDIMIEVQESHNNPVAALFLFAGRPCRLCALVFAERLSRSV